MEGLENDIMDDMQMLIGDELSKYHEEKIKRDQGEDPNPRPGRANEMKSRISNKKKLPRALIQQYLTLN